MKRKLKIAIATAGRFHVLDLARELHHLGHDVKFYSYVPKSRALKFGLPAECYVSLVPFAAPFLAWERLAGFVSAGLRERYFYMALNQGVMMRLHRCDVFIGMSGIYLEAAQDAKKRYAAHVWLERGSRHILSQDEILAMIPGARRPSQNIIRRELAGYELADRIVVPSHHVVQSFKRAPSIYSKLFCSPYGTDLKMFRPPADKQSNTHLTFLYVGQWSLQKGCDLLTAAMRHLSGVQLIHVGSIGDCTFPENDPRFVHVDSVPQWVLPKFYGISDVFLLPSREDGFGIVLGQALASGLPVICTDYTGGRDLAHTPALRGRITEVPHGDVAALVRAMELLREKIGRCGCVSPLLEADRETLSWAAYAKRYNEELLGSIS